MKSFKAHFIIKAGPQDVYAALTNQNILEIWTGEPSVMEEEPGKEFSWFDGAICGVNVAFEPGKKIEQDWFFGEDTLSRVTIKFHPDKKGTSLEIRQENIPDDDYENIAEGWEFEIVESLRDLLEED
jgi:activator of HSP90 ATPase